MTALGKFGAAGTGAKALSLCRDILLPNGAKILAEVAVEPEELIRGLMFREQLGVNEGMLFVEPNAGFYPVWMKNTLIPLDVIWLTASGLIVEMAQGCAPCKCDDCPQYGGRYSSSYILEVPAGTVRRNQLHVGDRLSW